MSKKCDFIVIFLIYGQVGAIQKSDYGRIVCKTYIFVNINRSLTKKWKQN